MTLKKSGHTIGTQYLDCSVYRKQGYLKKTIDLAPFADIDLQLLSTLPGLVPGRRRDYYPFLNSCDMVFCRHPLSSDQHADTNVQRLDWYCWLATNHAWVTIGFSDQRLRYRASKSNLQHELLLRAVRGRGSQGNSKKQSSQTRAVSVFDATAGLARDAWLLASAGFHVRANERIPLLAELLQQSLEVNRHALPATGSLSVECADSVQLMRQHSGAVDVVYLDPMYDGGLKPSAAVKHEMVFLRSMNEKFDPLQGSSNDGDQSFTYEKELLHAARNFACKKVVVKRAPHAPCLAQIEPASSIGSKAVRFDIYPV